MILIRIKILMIIIATSGIRTLVKNSTKLPGEGYKLHHPKHCNINKNDEDIHSSNNLNSVKVQNSSNP